MNLLFNSDVVNVLLKDNGGRNRRPIFVSCFFIIVFVDWSTLIGSVVVALGRELCLGPAEISSFCYWGIVLRGSEEFGYKKVCSRFSCEAPGMGRFSQDLLGVVRSGMWV